MVTMSGWVDVMHAAKFNSSKFSELVTLLEADVPTDTQHEDGHKILLLRYVGVRYWRIVAVHFLVRWKGRSGAFPKTC
jgi:hypothetical protein